MDIRVHYPYRRAPGGSLHISGNPPPTLTGPAVTLCLQKPILIIPHKGQARIRFASIMDYPPP